MMNYLEHYLSLPYEVTVTPEHCTDGSECYVARVVELLGCESHGDSPEEALENLQEAKQLFLTSMLDDGIEPARPVALTEGTYRGRTSVWRIVPTTNDDDRPRFVGTKGVAFG